MTAATNAGSPLQDAQFRRYLGTRAASTVAGQMLMVATGWQMYDLTGSAWDLGLVGLAQFVPALLLALPAGQTVDRHDRRRVLAAALGLLSAAAAALALASARGQITREALLGAAVVMGITRAYQMPSHTSLLPLLVPQGLLARAVAMSSATLQGAALAGPALGGAAYAAGPAAVYALSALGLAASLAAVLRLQPRAAARLSAPGSLHTLTAGVRFVFGHPAVLGAMSLDLFAVLFGGATALLPIFARDILDAGPLGLGLLRAAPAAGAVAMSLWLARRPLHRRVGRTLYAAVAVYGLAMGVFGLSHSMALSWLALAVSGAADMVSMVIRQTLVQVETPDEMRGRVGAVSAVFIGASNQLGEFESGALAAWLGPVGSVLAGSAGTLLVVAQWVRAFPALWRRDALATAPAPGGTSP